MTCSHDPLCPLVDVATRPGVVAVRRCILEAQVAEAAAQIAEAAR